MLITFGKNKGKSVQSIVLKEPDYVRWVVGEKSATGQMPAIQAEIKRLVSIFDSKGLETKCVGKNCNKLATRASVYLNNLSAHWWCDDCNPYQFGANSGKLQIIQTYSQALSQVVFYCNGNKADMKSIIKTLAQAKGLPVRVGEKQAHAFFL